MRGQHDEYDAEDMSTELLLRGGEADPLDYLLVLSGLVAVRNGFCLPDEAGRLPRIL